ncbi:hypothetical protein ES703_67759 [subsurface metagenome]
MKYREKWCPQCRLYIPPKGASSHKCMHGEYAEVLIGESKIKCKWFVGGRK